MKKLILLFTLLLVVSGVRAALPQPDLIAQIHFAGAQKISASANANAFTNEFCSAEALALRAQTANRLSIWLAGWLQKNTGVTVADGAAKLRPLFDDLQKSEWFLVARAAASGRPQVAIAIKLDAGRAKLWRENLKAILPSGVVEFSSGIMEFSYGTNNAAVWAHALAQRFDTPDANTWLSTDINWPRLAQWLSLIHI